jgi:histidinol-phosphate/aromatic aminotransferase/cobyric acid decarboxylase-like protein
LCFVLNNKKIKILSSPTLSQQYLITLPVVMARPRTSRHIAGLTEYKIPETSENVVNLAININFVEEKTKDLHQYPQVTEKHGELTQMIAMYNSVNPNQVLLTNGSGPGLRLILRTFCDSDTRLLIPTPNYPGFIQDAVVSGSQVVRFPFDGADVELLEKKIEDADAVYLSVPNLPLGYMVSAEKIQAWAKAHPSTLFIVDAAYAEYAGAEPSVDLADNILVTRTFSKVFGIPGARLGYIIGTPWGISRLRVCYSTKDLPSSAVDAGLAVLGEKDYFLKKAQVDIARLCEGCAKITEMIRERHLVVYGAETSGRTPWLLLKTRYPQRACAVYLRHGFLVRDKSATIPDSLRIGVWPADLHEKFLSATQEVVNMPIKTIFFDLDGTLRPDCVSDIAGVVRDSWAELTRLYDVWLVTNNPAPKGQLVKYLEEQKIPLEADKVLAPIKEPYDPTEGWFVQGGVVWLIRPPADYHGFLKEAVTRGVVVVIEDEYNTSSGEMGQTPDLQIPHTGHSLNFLRERYPQVEIRLAGKEMWRLPTQEPAVYIGDTAIDERCARANGVPFISVINTDITKVIRMLLKSA